LKQAHIIQYESIGDFSKEFSGQDAIEIVAQIKLGQDVSVPEKKGTGKVYVVMTVDDSSKQYLIDTIKNKGTIYSVSDICDQDKQICMTLVDFDILGGLSNFDSEILQYAR
ncbi:MAG: hypothetical protein GOU99_01420, partial [Candidatus Altiarchaeota archaeon]|nr:hypothetical protein [Candidatus Altiarchaeota archaeon]